jgi:hypothetical protein
MTFDRSCPICAYAADHGSWPPDHVGTHCRDCHRSWRGLKEAHCAACHEHFSSPAAFDRHLRHRRMTVTSPRSHRVENELVTTCIPAADFTKPRGKAGKPLLVASERQGQRLWVTKVLSEGSPLRKEPGK